MIISKLNIVFLLFINVLLKSFIMNKGVKIVILIIVSFALVLIATVLREAGVPAAVAIAGVVIIILYQVMFKKNKSDEQNKDKDITLKK